MPIGAKIKEIRESKGLSKYKLAKKSGISAMYLGEVEKGIKSPTVTVAFKIANGLDVSVTDLIGTDTQISA